MKNKVILFAKRPKQLPDASCFEMKEISVPAAHKGQVVVETTFISVDPYMRGRMREGKSYIDPFVLGEPMMGGVVGRVIESEDPSFVKGDHVVGMMPWQLYTAVDAKQLTKIDPQVPPSATLGVLGMPGWTAYFGLLDIGQPKAGETVVVSGAAGAVGTAVGQIAKIKGCRVVGIAGSEEKMRYLTDELGFDAAVNYKNHDALFTNLQNACPNGVDVYFDNVGGPTSDMVLPLLNKHARVPICGQISMYNEDKPDVGLRAQPFMLVASALMKGFIVFDYADRYPEAIKQMGEWVLSGKIRYRENIVDGFENAPKALVGLFHGENIGKQLVRI